MNKWFQQMSIYVLVMILAVIFFGLGWWIPLIVEIVIVVASIFVVAFFMVAFTLKRKAPVTLGDAIGLKENEAELNDFVRDAVHTLEEAEIWEQVSEDGLKLKGRFLKAENSHTYAVCCHGYSNHRLQDISNSAIRFHQMGHNVFAGHARGHGMSEGDYIGMGCKERRDITHWIERIVKMDPEAKIFLYGVSMGGATVMTTSGENLPPNVKCAIEDCGYTSAWDEFKYQLGESSGVPVFPILNLCQVISRKKYGYGFKEYSPISQVAKTHLPMLFIHGDKDSFVPFPMLDKVYNACGAEHKKKVVIEGAEHAESYKVNPETYYREINEWLDTYLV